LVWWEFSVDYQQEKEFYDEFGYVIIKNGMGKVLKALAETEELIKKAKEGMGTHKRILKFQRCSDRDYTVYCWVLQPA
jgi:hypothetical protein